MLPFNDSRLLELCDAKLRSEDGCCFSIHRIVLAMKSEYFCSMFCGTHDNMNDFTIPGISGKSLLEILEYIYSGEISVTEANIADLMVARDILLIEGLNFRIKPSLMQNITIGNCLKVFNTAYRLNDKCALLISFRIIETKFEEIMSTQKNDLAELSQEVLEKILSCRSLYVYSETTVWLAITKWIQKDSMRFHCVPQLLMYLAVKELDENLATEIMEHEIVSKNSFLEDLNELKKSPDFTSNLNTLVQFLEDRSSHFQHLGPYRIPPYLFVVYSFEIGENQGGDYRRCRLFVTYDENIDVWRKIGENLDSYGVSFLIIVRHSIYLFRTLNVNRCQKFDLISQRWIPMSHFLNNFDVFFRVVAVDEYIYVIGGVFKEVGEEVENVKMEVYDATNDIWFDGGSLSTVAARDNLNIYLPNPVTIDKRIYVVGRTRNSDGLTTMVFDTLSFTWKLLSPTRNTYWTRDLSVVAYRGKVYVISFDYTSKKVKVEVLNPEINLWRELPDLPCGSHCTTAVVLKDKIIVYDKVSGKGDPEGFRWNDGNERWEKIEVRVSSRDLKNHLLTIVDDVDTLRHITKRNRDPQMHLQKSLFGQLF